MKRIHRVIYQEIIPPGVLALVVLTFVVFTREFGRLTELLIRKNADPVTVFKAVGFLLPSILVFTVPIGFLIGTLVGFSRLSSESEIVAMRAGGIGVLQIMRPVLQAGTGVFLVTLALTLYLWPAGNWNLLLVRHSLGVRPVRSEVKPRVFNEDLPGKLLYVEDVDLASQNWEGVFLADRGDSGLGRIVLARRGEVLFSEDSKRLQLDFREGSSYEFHHQDPSKYRITRFGSLDVTVDLPEVESPAQRPKRPEDKLPGELLRDLRQATPKVQRESWVELNRRLALPLSAFIFAVLGVTLGITSHRGGRGYGSVVSLVIAFTYYVLFATGSRMAKQEALSIWIGVWGANILLGLAAVLSIRVARRGGSSLKTLTGMQVLGGTTTVFRNAFVSIVSTLRRSVSFARSRIWDMTVSRWRMTRVIDSYLAHAFTTNLLVTLLICILLFYLFTFFEIIDDMLANGTGYSMMFEYFAYLVPHVLTLLIPISILIATLTTFGVLEKTSQTVAFKSCGISIYRMTLPVIGLAFAICAGSFVLQDYVLPYSNQRQDNLRNLIKGRPVQTYYQPTRNWIFGEDNSLYNYNYFDTSNNSFAELSIFELKIQESHLLNHTYARRAEWNNRTQSWDLHEGWTRDLTKDRDAFTHFDHLSLRLPEKPEYFRREFKESSKMSYLELSDYVDELQKGGFEVDHLRTDLHKKISFPVVNAIMVILGVPFAFSIGRKGALYGVAAGILLGIFYWGAFGVFGVLGNNGLLSPLLAAWGPNLVFGLGSLLLFLHIRT